MNKKSIKLLANTYEGYDLFLVPDPRGATESFEAYSLEARRKDGTIAWHEGVRKDRAAMWDNIRTAIGTALEGESDENE